MGCRYGNSIGYIDHQLDMGIRTIHQWESKHQYINPYGLIPHSPIWLVGGWAQPLWKIWQLVSWDHDIPNIRKNKNCSKPPTSDYIWGFLGIIPLDLHHDSRLRSRREVVICPDDKIQLLINLTPECSLRITIPFLGWKKMKWPNSRVAKDVVDVMIVMTVMSQCFHFFDVSYWMRTWHDTELIIANVAGEKRLQSKSSNGGIVNIVGFIYSYHHNKPKTLVIHSYSTYCNYPT